jgi:hypothetical protein
LDLFLDFMPTLDRFLFPELFLDLVPDTTPSLAAEDMDDLAEDVLDMSVVVKDEPLVAKELASTLVPDSGSTLGKLFTFSASMSSVTLRMDMSKVIFSFLCCSFCESTAPPLGRA